MKNRLTFVLVSAALGAISCGNAAVSGGGSASKPDSIADSAGADLGNSAVDAPAAGDGNPAVDAIALVDSTTLDEKSPVDANPTDGAVAKADVPPAVDIPLAQDIKKPLLTHGITASGDTNAPEFSNVVDSSGAKVSPGDLAGKWTVMWFYPAASTAG